MASTNSRITHAVQKLQAEAARALAKETPPPRARPAGRSLAAEPPSPCAFLKAAERAALVEVMDGEGRPLVCMPPEAALRQKLRLWLAVVALRTVRNTIILHRREESKLGGAGLWDAYTDFVLVGEAREDAAIRLLAAYAGNGGLRMRHVADREDSPVGLALFVADFPPGVYPAYTEGEFLETDADELRGLARDTPELFSAELLWAEACGALFSCHLPRGAIP